MSYDTPDRAWLGDDIESRVIEIGEAYLDQLQEGIAPERAALLGEHSDLGSALETRLRLIELLFRAWDPMP